MSEANFSASDEPAPNAVNPESTPATPPPRKPVSSARKLISLVLLIGLLVAGGIQLLAVISYNKAVAKLQAILSDDTTVSRPHRPEIETRIGKKTEGPGVIKGPERMVSYTWQGLRGYEVKIFYDPMAGDRFLRFETGDAGE